MPAMSISHPFWLQFDALVELHRIELDTAIIGWPLAPAMLNVAGSGSGSSPAALVGSHTLIIPIDQQYTASPAAAGQCLIQEAKGGAA